MHSRVLGADVLHSLYLPPGYRTSNSGSAHAYPVLFLLHGGGDDDSTAWLRKGDLRNIMDTAIAAGRIPPMVVAMPDARRDASLPQTAQPLTFYLDDADGSFRYATMFLEEFVPHIESHHTAGGSPGRRAVGGMSMGGFGALSFALRRPGMFSGVIGLSAAHRTAEQILALDTAGWNHRYGRGWGEDLAGRARLNDLYRRSDPVEIIKRTSPEALSRSAYFLDCGAYDDLFAGNADLHLVLTDRKVPHRFMCREGTHEWAYWTSGLPTALEFLAEHLDG